MNDQVIIIYSPLFLFFSKFTTFFGAEKITKSLCYWWNWTFLYKKHLQSEFPRVGSEIQEDECIALLNTTEHILCIIIVCSAMFRTVSNINNISITSMDKIEYNLLNV